ncbi:SDR family oxidoreductase [Burkholderia pyrrocinia]|uniref:SDR family oxidoreductase n=1 Tax=Burkholderia pyrrocinia TaxID=60550 RepID=UPI002AB0BA16|nr:SDR family NAD(P)-dependent oxidoreductase [Burkholderia pyrrocinia]
MTQLVPGQVVVVTGGATGIGFALAEAFASRGLRIALADIDSEGLRAATERLADRGVTVIGVPTDVADRDSVRSLRQQVLSQFGKVDIVCNNAGIYQVLDSIWNIDPVQWRRLFDINYWGVVHGIQEFVPLFLERGSGHVVNTASMSGLSTVPGSADYGSSKHAVIALSETLRADLDLAGATAIGVTVLCPSIVGTTMGERALTFLKQSAGDRSAIGSGPNLANVITSEAVAKAAMLGIEKNLLHVTPTPGSRDRFLKRVQPILDNWQIT